MRVERNWAETFRSVPPGRIHLFGPIAVHAADWSQPQRGQSVMFDPRWLERLSVVHPLVPATVYAPAGLWLAWSADASPLSVLGRYAAGLLIWSLLEYVAHRGSFHHAPTSRLQLALCYVMHGVHHAYPDDSRRWMMPLSVTAPIAVVLYAALGRLAPDAFGGFLHGYLAYDLLHYFIHRGPMTTRVGRYLRQHHLVHHYSHPERNFGVSSPLWDVVFRTR